jgi:hypothetical protein
MRGGRAARRQRALQLLDDRIEIGIGEGGGHQVGHGYAYSTITEI